MKFFEWLNPPESEVERAIKLLKKQSHKYKLGENQMMIGKYKTVGILSSMMGKSPKAYFSYYSVKFNSTNTKAMISKDGTVDFFFTTQEEVEALRSAIINHFG